MSNQVPTRVVSFRIIAGTGESSGLTEPGLHVLRDRGEFERLWSVVQSQHSASLTAPHVDWSQETVVVVALGTRPTGGYTICVDRLTEQRGTLTVHARETRPGTDDYVCEALTQPFTALGTPAYAGTIELETTVVQRD